MPSIYDPIYLRDFYDLYGESEWFRFERSASQRINYEVHLHILSKYLRPGIEVLEIGPGPGRFTIPMAESGAQLTLVDISQRQLDLNEERLSEAGLERMVRTRHQGDMLDLSRFEDNSFDLVTAYGGPLSYVFDMAPHALSEMERVARPEGHVLFSVMSKWGSTRSLLPAILQ